MSPKNEDLNRLLQVIERLSGDVARLEARIAKLEATSAAPAAAVAPAPAAATAPDPIDTDTIMTIAAAIAAYLGKKPRIRAIRLLSSEAWAQQGRATIQAWYSVSPHPTR